MDLFDVNPEDYSSDIEFFILKYGEDALMDMVSNDGEIIYDRIEDETVTDEKKVKAIFDQLRQTPFKNATERPLMGVYLSQLAALDTPEVRVLFKQIGKILNDLADNGLIDNSVPELEENLRVPKWKSIFKEAQHYKIPGTNVEIMKIATDTNGNKSLYLKTFTGKNFKIQTNGRLPYIHSNFDKRDFGKIIDDKKAVEEIKADLKEFPMTSVKVY